MIDNEYFKAMNYFIGGEVLGSDEDLITGVFADTVEIDFEIRGKHQTNS